MAHSSGLTAHGIVPRRRLVKALVAAASALGMASLGVLSPVGSAHAAQPDTAPYALVSTSLGAGGVLKAPTAATQQVNIANFAFSPASLTVSVGTTVNWVNSDSTAHTVTSSGSGPLNSPTLNPGGTYSYTFTTAGTYPYVCAIHSFMQGTVVVK